MQPAHESDDISDENKLVMQILKTAHTVRSDPDTAEKSIQYALQLAPHNIDAHIGAYRFYFYNQRYSDALQHAQFIIEHSARRMNICIDWQKVLPTDSDFTLKEYVPGLYLQALLAWGFSNIKSGNVSKGREAVVKVIEIDPSDRFNARSILSILDNETSNIL
ncbi:MAG: hypothetical protein HRT83_06095 [Hyphomicrobiaceae bacterium]|nr:hypothetical protein [Hyphomicrobiaceae bacterium]